MIKILYKTMSMHKLYMLYMQLMYVAWCGNRFHMYVCTQHMSNTPHTPCTHIYVHKHILDHCVHLVQFFSHGRVIWSKDVSAVIDSKKVAHYEISIVGMYFWDQMFYHTVVNSVKVFHVEGWEIEGFGEELVVESHPGIVPHERHLKTLVMDLSE